MSSIALTVGFTHQTERADLFEGNHRVSRVRVVRQGTELGVFDLDPSSRELQTLPVSGAGGTYRIEIAAVAPGSREDWREACISELRVLGRAASAAPESTRPRVAIGTLPALPAALPPPPAPRTPLPPALAAIGDVLREHGILSLARIGDVFDGTRRQGPVWAVRATDASGTWACIGARYTPARCVSLSPQRLDPRISRERDERVRFAYGEGGATIAVTLSMSDSPRATRRLSGAPDEAPLPEPATREAPPWLASLEGLEIASHSRGIAAAASGWLTLCDTEPVSCATPGWIDPLSRGARRALAGAVVEGDVYSVDFSWSDRAEDSDSPETAPEEHGFGTVHVRRAPAVRLVATTIDALEHRERGPHGGYDVPEMESFEQEMRTDTCLQAGRPVGARRHETEDFDERELGAIRFERAPDEVPATGLADPLAISLEGAWDVLPEGGLRRRTRPCPE